MEISIQPELSSPLVSESRGVPLSVMEKDGEVRTESQKSSRLIVIQECHQLLSSCQTLKEVGGGSGWGVDQ